MQASPSTDPPTTRAHPLTLTFATWLSGSKVAGLALIHSAAATDDDLTAQLAAVLRVVSERRRRTTAREDLDGVLRSDPTAVVDQHHPLIHGDVRRLHVLQRELQRACLTATLLTLPPAPRAAFILLEILGLPFDRAAEIIGSAEALRTAHRRAVSELDAYLGPRCEHMDPKNRCHCATRLGVALERGFVVWPDRDDLASDAPLLAERRREVADLFADLPAPL